VSAQSWGGHYWSEAYILRMSALFLAHCPEEQLCQRLPALLDISKFLDEIREILGRSKRKVYEYFVDLFVSGALSEDVVDNVVSAEGKKELIERILARRQRKSARSAIYH